MKPLRRLIVPITVALLCVGCGSALQRRLTVGELTAFRRYGWTGMDDTLRVEIRCRRALLVADACLTLYYAGGELGRIELRGEAFVAPRGDSEVPMRWRIDLSDPAAGYLIEKKMRAGETALFAVVFSGRVCSGSRCRDISLPMMPLSDFLAIFGVSLADMQNRLYE